MSNREPHNTETLQKRFPKVYREFFAKCQRVASAPNSFLWTGEFSGFYEGGLMISQKLPFRVYVGLEKAGHGQTKIDKEYTTFEAEENRFVKKVLDPQLADQFEAFLGSADKDVKHISGLNVHILTEAPLGHGLGSNGTLAAALAILISKENSLKKRFLLARKILAASQRGYSSGVSAYNALVDADQPIVFFSCGGKFVSYPISEIIGVKKLESWPIDFGLIYSGTQTNSANVVIATEHTLSELNEEGENVNKLLKDYSHPPFKETYLNMLNMTSSLMVSGFAKIFKKGLNDSALEDFFDTLNQYQNLLHILDLSTKTSDVIYRHIHELANKEINGSGSGVKISGLGKGGVMLFAMPYGSHRKNLVALVDNLRCDFNNNIWLDYASWLDGVGKDAGRIEQDTADGTASVFLDKDVVDLTIFDHGQQLDQVAAIENYKNIVANIDIVLDKTTGKILIAGKSLTSKDLPSQKATVLIISELLEADGFSLSNDAIKASYGTNRYDLHSKIMLPLCRQVKKISKKDLQLSITGGMYDNYQLKLDPSNISVAVITKKR